MQEKFKYDYCIKAGENIKSLFFDLKADFCNGYTRIDGESEERLTFRKTFLVEIPEGKCHGWHDMDITKEYGNFVLRQRYYIHAINGGSWSTRTDKNTRVKDDLMYLLHSACSISYNQEKIIHELKMLAYANKQMLLK